MTSAGVEKDRGHVHKPRMHPDVVYTKISPNQSDRALGISLIVLHSTESTEIPHSAADLEGIANYFANPAAQVSAHVIVDGDGHSARCVEDERKAWHCVAYNSAALGIEQIGRAASTNWDADDELVRETARWIAVFHHRHGVPIQVGAVSGGRVTRPGVLRHMDLGVEGGGHSDPGPNYPFNHVIERAQAFAKRGHH